MQAEHKSSGSTSGGPRRRHVLPARWPLGLLVASSILALGFVAATLWAYRYLNDAALARYIMERFNPKLRGRLEFGKLHWQPQAVVDLAMGVPTRVEVEHFAVYDPRGGRVIYAPRATGKLELYPLLAGGNLLIHEFKAEGVSCLVSAVQDKAGLRVGLLEAFSSRKPSQNRRGPRIAFLDFALDGTHAMLQFPAWSLALEGVRSRGSFIYGGGKPAEEGLVIAHSSRVSSGWLTIGEYSLPLKDVEVRRFGGSPRDPSAIDIDLDGTVGEARVEARGKMTDVYRGHAGIALAVEIQRLQQLLQSLLKIPARGAARLTATLQGPLGAPLIEAQLEGLGVGLQASGISDLRGRVRLDVGRSLLAASRVQARAFGGRVEGQGDMDLKSGDWQGRVALQDLDPRGVHPLLAGSLSGSVSLKGGTRPLRRGLAVLRLGLDRSRQDTLPRHIEAEGTVHLAGEVIDLAGLTLRAEGNSLQARGSLNLRLGQTNLFLALKMPRLESWLARRGLPTVARSATSELHVTGRLPNIRARGKVAVHGVGYGALRLARLGAEVEFADGALHLKRLVSQGYGGKLGGEASLQLFDGSILRPRAVPLLQARVAAAGMDLLALGGGPHVDGRVDAELEVGGPLDHPSGTVTLRAPRTTILGERYVNSEVRLGLLGDRVSIYSGKLQRAGGGRISLHGDVAFDQNLDLRLAVHDYPLVAIPSLARPSWGLGGKVSGQLHVTGTLSNPRPAGRVTLNDAQLRGASFGSGVLTLIPGADAIGISGQFFGRLLKLEGYLLTQPQPRLHLTINVTGLPLEKVLPEVRQLGDVRGVLDGRIRLALDAEEGLTWADARFNRVNVELRYRPPGSRRLQTINLTNQEDLLARYDNHQLHIVTARLLTSVAGSTGQRAELSVGGSLSPEQVDMRLRGKIAVKLLEFFLARRVAQLQGDAAVDVRFAGPLERPTLEGGLSFNRVRIRMPRFEREIEIPTGAVRLVPGALRLIGLQVRMGRSKLSAAGTLSLEKFRPSMAELSLGGEIDAKILELFFPAQLSAASGAAAVSLVVRGPVEDPQFEGVLGVKHLELTPRGLGRNIMLSRGQVALSNYEVKTLEPLEGTYDEGMLRISGGVRLDRWDLADVELHIAGTGIPHRQPNVYNAELNLDLDLLGDSHRLELQGSVDLVDVRYIRPFDIIRQAFIQPRVYEEEDPFWKGRALLEDLKLQLIVRSMGQMMVKNDYAQLSLSGNFAVSGTLAEPRLGGVIRVDEGTFRIPFLRGEYTLRRGEIAFDKRRPIEAAELSLTGETVFTERSGVDYQIKLLLDGPLDQIKIQLSSDPPLDQGQIWALLATGRTTDQLRAQLKGGSDPSTTGSSPAAGVADAQTKQLTGEILDGIVSDPLRKVTRLDLLRFELGTESAQVKASKRLGRFINLAGEAEVGLLGDSRAEGRLEFKMHDLLMLVGKLERLSTRLETEDVDPSRGRIELKLSLPLR